MFVERMSSNCQFSGVGTVGCRCVVTSSDDVRMLEMTGSVRSVQLVPLICNSNELPQ